MLSIISLNCLILLTVSMIDLISDEQIRRLGMIRNYASLICVISLTFSLLTFNSSYYNHKYGAF